jgi:hypothetical protein
MVNRHFVPDIIDEGRNLEQSIQVPPSFYDDTRILSINAGVEAFNVNTYQAQEFKEKCKEVHASYSMKTSIYGNPMVLNMPFNCKERIVDSEIQAYPNNVA